MGEVVLPDVELVLKLGALIDPEIAAPGAGTAREGGGGGQTPADMLAERTVQARMNELMERNPRCTVKDVIDELMKIREYAEAFEGQQPEVWVGSPDSFAGKIYVEMYGVGAPTPEEYDACSDAGVGTFVGMHATPEVIEAVRKKGKSNLIIAGHMASDSLGFNQILDMWEKQGIEVVRISGIV